MVSPTTTTPTPSEMAAGLPGREQRRIGIEEFDVVVGRTDAPVIVHRPFWSYIIAGSLIALSVFVLSWYLMLGFHVGITDTGLIDLGGGAAVWLWVTSCIAFLIGGRISTLLEPTTRTPLMHGAISGATVWGLSIPLAILAYGHSELANVFSSLVYATGIPTAAEVPSAHVGFHWAVFIALLIGLVCSIVGGISGYFVRVDGPSAATTRAAM